MKQSNHIDIMLIIISKFVFVYDEKTIFFITILNIFITTLRVAAELYLQVLIN